MKITFLGAAHEVTGSCTLIEVNGHYGLVDCGMEQGKNLFENQPIPLNPGQLEFVLLTHAHIDHAGNLPLLHKNGFNGQIYTTEATKNLCNIMLMDCAHIQESDAAYKSKKAMRSGKGPVIPLYDLNDATETLALFRSCSYGKTIQITDGIQIRFTDVGHLLGSACIEIWCTENDITKKIVFSGDIGNLHQPILKDPNMVEEADFIVIESTYGDRIHSEIIPDYVGSLASYIQQTMDRGGNVIIPSFAVGRTQEILYFIREIKNRNLVKNHPGFPVYIDSPLAESATAVFLQADSQYLDEEANALLQNGENPLWFKDLKTAVSSDESKILNTDPIPKVIISASGMCDAGRVRHHLKHNLWRPECSVLFVGYQAQGTVGRKLIDGADFITLFGEKIACKAQIGQLPGISGHADKNGLLRWLRGFKNKPLMVFVNHGENTVTDSFAETVHREFGYDSYAPYSGTTFDMITLELNKAIPVPIQRISVQDKPSSLPHKEEIDYPNTDAFDNVLQSADAVQDFISTLKNRSDSELTELSADLQKIIKKYK